MKTIFTFFALSLSIHAFAVSENSTWEEIKNSNKVSALAPTIAFDAGAAISFVSVLDVCSNGNEVQTINKMNVYKHVQIGHKNDIEVIGSKNLTHEKTYTHLVWRKLPGSSSEVQVEITETIADDYKVDVVEKMLGSSKTGRKLFQKEYSISACK